MIGYKNYEKFKEQRTQYKMAGSTFGTAYQSNGYRWNTLTASGRKPLIIALIVLAKDGNFRLFAP